MRTANWARFFQALLTLCLKQISKQSFGLLQSFVRQDNRFGVPYRVGDQALLVQPLHRVPVERLPNALTVMPPQQKQRQHTVINSRDPHEHRPLRRVAFPGTDPKSPKLVDGRVRLALGKTQNSVAESPDRCEREPKRCTSVEALVKVAKHCLINFVGVLKRI